MKHRRLFSFFLKWTQINVFVKNYTWMSWYKCVPVNCFTFPYVLGYHDIKKRLNHIRLHNYYSATPWKIKYQTLSPPSQNRGLAEPIKEWVQPRLTVTAPAAKATCTRKYAHEGLYFFFKHIHCFFMGTLTVAFWNSSILHCTSWAFSTNTFKFIFHSLFHTLVAK